MKRREFARQALLGLGGTVLSTPALAESSPPALHGPMEVRAAAAEEIAVEASPSPAGWKVDLISEKEIIRGWWYPNALFFHDGIILCTLASGDGKSRLTVYSEDRGGTWKQKQAIDRKDGEYLDTLGDGAYLQLADGSMIGVMFHSVVQSIVAALHQSYQPFIAHVRRAQSPRDLLDGKYVDDFAKVTIPDLAAGFGDDGKLYTGSVDHGLVELANGDLLLTMYGSFHQDNIPIPYFHHGAVQFRTWVCISKDRGKTWSYLATVASPEASPLPAVAEGYCEPGLLRLDGDNLLMVMRSGGHPTHEGGAEWFTPLYANFSPDGGATWTPPAAIYKYGVWPRLLKMQDGTIVCESGRPGVFLLFSRDGGKSWSHPFVISSLNGRWGHCPSGYSSITEIEPGVLGIIYDDYLADAPAESAHVIKMALYRIHAR